MYLSGMVEFRMVENYESWSHDLLIQIEIEVHTHHNHTSTQQSHSMRSLGEQLRPDSGGETPVPANPQTAEGNRPVPAAEGNRPVPRDVCIA